MTQTGVPLVYLFHFLFFFSAPPPTSRRNRQDDPRISRNHDLGPHGRDDHEAPRVDQRVRREAFEEDKGGG